MVAELKQS